MMLLKDLLAPWFHYAGSETVAAPTLDSRKVVSGGLFVAVPGFKTDGREYISAAFKNGAAAVLKHTDNPEDHGKVSSANGLVIEFFRLNRQVSALAAQYYGLIPGKPRIVGVTGTNGKTSVTQLIAQWVELYGQQAGVMGTLGNGRPGHLHDTGNTTADAITLMAQFKQMGESGVNVCAMEVSSHGLVQGRVDAVPFEVAVFTNLSRDHLDFHKSMEAYAAAKQRLLRFPTVKKAAVNLDDSTGSAWFDSMDKTRLLGFSLHRDPRATLLALNADYHHAGIQALIRWPGGEGQLQTPLLGEFNLSNLLAALTALYALGYPLKALLQLAPQLQPVPGRMECFASAQGFSLVVDYAHTPDGLEKALLAAREHCQGQLWCVFGCGGDRDKGKRPQMGAIAERLADRLMITSDNIRSEDPQQIINDIVAGLAQPQQALTEVDRVRAIRYVVSQAKAGDLIVLAGKGHETYQEIAGVKHHYDERALAREISGGQQ